ncbi:MBL fold metallo-hydrolase [Clostridium sp.]|uniref:MBL fold metallo-hydrolase n=1 Tax=Clostridium sp. TaxID=1506 RepID=UPI002842A5AF|nr:MBL fold metallo-hydrolase [Clostridium sp.]MDR3595931.1 MBL fold metallo-hydrolase [Clostridium sp.]
MRVIHEKTIYQLTFLPTLFPVNCYLVEESDSLTLIDAALSYSYKKIIKMADKIGKPITRIVLTHVHDDHVGALDALKELLPNVIVYVSKRDSRLMSGDVSLDKGEPDMPIKGSIPKKLKTRADVLVNDGDKIGSLIAISTPGHTPGSFCYLDTRNKAVIVGDTMQTRGGTAVGGQVRPTFPFPAMATWNKEMTLKSVKKLMEYEPTLLAAGHGNMIKEPKEAMNRAIIECEHKLKHA